MFVRIEVVAECYLINWRRKKESKDLLFQINLTVKLADGRMSKKEIISLYLVYNIIVQSKHKLLKNRTFLMIDKLNMVSCQVLSKFSCWRNLFLYWIMLTKLKHLSVFGLWAIMTTSERAPILLIYKHRNYILQVQLLTDSQKQ